jgi:magnesium transporter
MEDVLNTEQRPKLEDYEGYLFVVLKRLGFDRREGRVSESQVSIVLGAGFVLSFQESGGPLFEPVRQRIRGTRGRLRKLGPDFLLHALIDCVVDEYFGVLEQVGEEIERLEEQILDRPSPVAMRTLHRLKRELIALRRSVWPLREVIGGLDRSDSTLLSPGVELYLRDVYDHTIHVIDTVESYRDTLSGLLDVYLSSLSNRMNEIMKLLTIISTIFIPLTFIAGVYGMNFRHMPELEWRWGYFAVLGGMLAVALALVVFFRRRRWL